jgi:hypothetical protein
MNSSCSVTAMIDNKCNRDRLAVDTGQAFYRSELGLPLDVRAELKALRPPLSQHVMNARSNAPLCELRAYSSKSTSHDVIIS